jgi:diguanylate cyclase (GGDEF)-like protein/PAS domain S-box-containing protein
MLRLAKFRETPIGVMLWLLIVVNSSIALVLAGAGLLVYQRYEQNREAVIDITTEAEVLAESSTAALSFEDSKAARATLAPLHVDPDVVQAILFDRKGEVFATYERAGIKPDELIRSRRPDGVYREKNLVLTFQPVQFSGERIGTIFLSQTSDVNGELLKYLAIMALVFFASLGLALLLSSGMQGAIATPVRQLSEVARRITIEKNYSFRALPHGSAEIGILMASFNEMLSQIEKHDLARIATGELLRESEERYALAARGSNDGLWDWKMTTREIYFSSRWKQMLGYAESEILPDPEEWFSRIHAADSERVQSEIAAHREGSTREFASEYRMRHRNGSYIWMLSRGAAVRDEQGVAMRMAGSQTDITEGKIVDPLTGLPNRLYFLDRLSDALQKASSDRAGFAVLFIDIDRFKLVNDTLGHSAGDELLVGIARRLRGAVRSAGMNSADIAQSVVARLGGDEFAFLLGGIEHMAEATAVASGIIESLNAPFSIEGRQVFGGVSIGVAPGNSGVTPEEVLRNADTAMYHAKAQGKGRWAVFDEKMRDRAKARLEIETELHDALELEQFVLFYQPQVSVESGRVTGYEALVRWQHPTRGLLAPSEFISIAEETGLIVPLGLWVLSEACRQMSVWNRTFDTVAPLTISVNVSFHQLSGCDLVMEVRKALRETQLRPECLKLEMTESSVMSNADLAIDILRRLKGLGVGLEIDDFGTGYSSLSYFSRLPFDTVKIDRSFIKDLLNGGSESSEIVRTILDLARSMRMNVVAEGVETAEQFRALSKLGCDLCQGYYFSKPTSKDATEALIRERYEMRRTFTYLEASREAAPAVHADADFVSEIVSGERRPVLF